LKNIQTFSSEACLFNNSKHEIMDVTQENYHNGNDNENISNHHSHKDYNQTINGINEISSTFWDEINNEIASNDLPLWRMWR